MPSKSKKASRKKTARSARKSTKSKKAEFPDIIEEPIRVIGAPKRNRSKSATSRKTK